MRPSAILGIALALGLAGCEQSPSARPAPSAEPATAAPGAVAAAPVAAAVPDSCGGACGGSCGGMSTCNGSCGAAATAEAPAAEVPADAQWTMVHVAGMRCGGCARRVKSALARVDGVLGVEVDVGKAEVRIATARGGDARALATDPINALGYQVLAN